jgi:hypothetical protein
MRKTCLQAAIAALALGFSSASAESALADPTFAPGSGEYVYHPATLASFSLAGADIAFTAVGRTSRLDTQKRVDDLNEAQAFSKVFPGYPQPAYVTFQLNLSF